MEINCKNFFYYDWCICGCYYYEIELLKNFQNLKE